jgi:dephospho-CoA kinase
MGQIGVEKINFMIIIGITGTLGAGKGTIVDYLVHHYHFCHYSVRKYLTQILLSEGKEVNRDNFTALANSLRATYNSPSYLIEKLFEEANINGQNCIIESIRTPGEIDNLRAKNNFYLLAVDANSKTRYDRIVNFRKSETDNISYETFIDNEQREYRSTDPNNQNLSKCIERADFVLNNDREVSYLYGQIDEIMQKIMPHESGN